MARRSGLGKGLDSLISRDYTQTVGKSTQKDEVSTVVSTKREKKVDKSVDNQWKDAQLLKIALVEPNRQQPRKYFDEEALEELAESIRQYGILQPLLVKPEDKHYVIVAGERRWRAAKIAGCKEVPAIVKDFSEQEIMEIALIENVQREDLNVIEEALAYQRLLTEFSYRQEDLAQKISKSRTVITNRLRLLKLTERVQGMLQEGIISEGHARALIPLEDPEVQYQTAMKVMDEHLSVRETEKLVKSLLNPAEPKSDEWKQVDQFIYDKWEEDLRVAMGTKVSIKRKNKDKGHITIDYYSTEELERLMEMLGKL